MSSNNNKYEKAGKLTAFIYIKAENERMLMDINLDETEEEPLEEHLGE